MPERSYVNWFEKFKTELEKNPKLKLYHVQLNGPLGITWDTVVPAENDEAAISSCKAFMCSLKENDFSGEASKWRTGRP